MLVSQAKQAAEIVLSVPDRMRAFALCDERVFDKAVEGWERLVILLRIAVLWIRTLQGFRQHSDSSLHIFAGIGGKGGGELIIELSEYHGMTLIQNFLVTYR
jgi:hypothetical protein